MSDWNEVIRCMGCGHWRQMGLVPGRFEPVRRSGDEYCPICGEIDRVVWYGFPDLYLVVDSGERMIDHGSLENGQSNLVHAGVVGRQDRSVLQVLRRGGMPHDLV